MSERKGRQTLQRALKAQAPAGRPTVFVPRSPAAIMDIGVPSLPPSSFRLCCGTACFPQFISLSPWVFTFLDVNLACVFESQFFFIWNWPGKISVTLCWITLPTKGLWAFSQLRSCILCSITFSTPGTSGGLSPTFPHPTVWNRTHTFLIPH